MLILHHLNKLLQRFEFTGRAVDGKHKCRMAREGPNLEARGNRPGEITLARSVNGGGATAQPQKQAEGFDVVQ
jgi:hypothetical protein